MPWPCSRLKSELHRAVEQGEFQVYYQPITSLNTGQITGVEALLRWQHPRHGLIYPGEFVPMLEETGLVVPIGEWLLRTACTQVKHWQTSGYGPLRLSVNVSVRQVQDSEFPGRVKAILATTGLDAGWLELEVTESIAMRNIDFSLTLLNELRAAGLGISIDDFGTGYSSLERLRHLPLRTLKIDRSFVNDIPGHRSSVAITTAIITMAHSLNLKVIAEGVETAEQMAFLQSRQCDEGQGFLFGQPVQAETLTEILQAGRTLPCGTEDPNP